MRCSEILPLLPRMNDDEPVDLRAQRHIDTCLGCQAEVARYQKMFRALGDLRHTHLRVPATYVDETLAALDGASARFRVLTRKQKAAMAGAMGAVAAGAAATIIVVARRRGVRVVPALSRS